MDSYTLKKIFLGGNYSLPALTLAGAASNALAGVAGLRLPGQVGALSISPVVLVSNLNEEVRTVYECVLLCLLYCLLYYCIIYNLGCTGGIFALAVILF